MRDDRRRPSRYIASLRFDRRRLEEDARHPRRADNALRQVMHTRGASRRSPGALVSLNFRGNAAPCPTSGPNSFPTRASSAGTRARHPFARERDPPRICTWRVSAEPGRLCNYPASGGKLAFSLV